MDHYLTTIGTISQLWWVFLFSFNLRKWKIKFLPTSSVFESGFREFSRFLLVKYIGYVLVFHIAVYFFTIFCYFMSVSSNDHLPNFYKLIQKPIQSRTWIFYRMQLLDIKWKNVTKFVLLPIPYIFASIIAYIVKIETIKKNIISCISKNQIWWKNFEEFWSIPNNSHKTSWYYRDRSIRVHHVFKLHDTKHC